MADILEEIVAHKRIEIEQRKRFIQPRQMITLTEQKMQENGGKVMGGSMKEALVNSETGIIAEFKRKSPSKGWIKEEGKPSIIPLSYQKNGASVLSILTDIDYFGGYDEYIQERAMWVFLYLYYIRTSSSRNISSCRLDIAVLLLYYSLRLASVRKNASG